MNLPLRRDANPHVATAQVELPRPQETLMWEQFARDVRKVQAGGAPNEHWPQIAYATQRVVQAVYESAKGDNKTVRL